MLSRIWKRVLKGGHSRGYVVSILLSIGLYSAAPGIMNFKRWGGTDKPESLHRVDMYTCIRSYGVLFRSFAARFH